MFWLILLLPACWCDECFKLKEFESVSGHIALSCLCSNTLACRNLYCSDFQLEVNLKVRTDLNQFYNCQNIITFIERIFSIKYFKFFLEKNFSFK